MATLATVALFLAACSAISILWNRYFRPVPVRLIALFVGAVAAYQAPTLFTSKVDVPASLAFRVQPWMSLGRRPANANTGIVFTQLVPWTEAARRSIRAGELPLWNRDSAAGSPLFGNQQTALLHPFTLLGLLLPVGKAFTLTASLRLFSLLFFTFVFLRWWDLDLVAAVAGAFIYTFCTFHVVWLLFPLGLATMMLPLTLAGVNEIAGKPSRSSFALLTIGLSAAVLGGHPESALWVGVITGAYALYVAWVRKSPKTLLPCAGAAGVAIALTAVFWLPTVALLSDTSRFGLKEAMKGPHRYSWEWFEPLFRPNALGTPMAGTYRPPTPANPGVLDDYGEIASGYAGALPLVLSIGALVCYRRRPAVFFLAAMLFAVATITEAPGWINVFRHVPLLSITLLQRLRFLWALGVAVTSAVALDWLIRRFQWGRLVAVMIGLITLVDLLTVTHGYNPVVRPRDLYTETGAIKFLRSHSGPHRFVAAGWSFISETPSFYGIEDVKTTDPMANRYVLRFIKGYLGVQRGDYDQIVRDFEQPFFDYLGIRYVYVPPDGGAPSPRFREVYSGIDGRVFENPKALPRFFLVTKSIVEPSFDVAVGRSKQIRDFRESAIVDAESPSGRPNGTGTVVIREYTANGAVLDIATSGECLLVSSEPAVNGWRLTWNGNELPVRKVNGAFVGAYVPGGRGLLRFVYRPRSFEIGVVVSFFTIAALGVVLALGRARWVKAPPDADQP